MARTFPPLSGTSWKVPFRDLRIADDRRRAAMLAAVEAVFRHGRFLMGPEVDELERALAEDCGARHAVGLASGSDALYLALRAFEIGSGDEVVTTPLSWIATLNAIVLTGATPVFADIGPDLNIDPASVEARIGPKTRAIVPVHFNGRLCDMRALGGIAERHHLLLIEDAAQAYGAHRGGRWAGSFGDAGCFSFNPMKVLPACGEAGAVVTDRAKIAERLCTLRYLGMEGREVCREPALNAKIDTLQAALLLVARRYFEANVARRLELARRYSGALGDLVVCPVVEMGPDRPCVFFDYTIQSEARDALRDFLAARGIETKIKHTPLMPDQPAYRNLPRPPLPVADRLVARILSLPIDENMTDDQADYVIDGIREFFHGA